MWKLKSKLMHWLETIEAENEEKNHTEVTLSEKLILKAHFVDQPKPTREEVRKIATNLGLTPRAVRSWFYRQRHYAGERRRYHAKKLLH